MESTARAKQDSVSTNTAPFHVAPCKAELGGHKSCFCGMEGRNSHHKTSPTTFFNPTAAVLPGKIACFARQYVPFRDAILPVLHRTKPFANAQSDKHMTQQTAGQHFKTAHARMAYLPARMPASTKRRPRRGFCKHCSQQARHHYKAYKIRQAAKPRAGKQKGWRRTRQPGCV